MFTGFRVLFNGFLLPGRGLHGVVKASLMKVP